jgi:hypothetical protein
MLDLVKYLRDIQNMDANETFDPTTDSLEALSTAISAMGFGPGVSLWMFGRCATGMAASQTVITTDNLTATLPNDIFNDEFYMAVIHNANAVGTAPEGEWRRISDFVGATQTFTTDGFSANVEENDLVMIIHESILFGQPLGRGTLDTSSQTVPADSTRTEGNDYFKGYLLMATEGAARFQPRPIRQYIGATGVFVLDEPLTTAPGTVDYVVLPSAYPVQRLLDIFNIVNALLLLTETGGTLTADGTEQTVYINDAPSNTFEPVKVQVDCTNMALGDVVVLRLYYRIIFGGNLIKKDEVTLNGAQDPELKNIELEPNRYGIQVTLEQTAGTNRDYDWATFYRS